MDEGKPRLHKERSGAHLMGTALAVGASCVILIIATFAAFYDHSQRNIRRYEIEQFLTSVGDAGAWGVDNWLASRTRLAENLAYRLRENESLSRPEKVELLKSNVYEETFIWTYYGEPNGGYYIWPPDEELPADYFPPSRPWYIDAAAAGETVLTEPYLDITTKVETITVATPVYRKGELVGVVGADFSTKSLAEMLRNMDLGGLGHAFLLTGEGKIIAHPQRDLVTKTLADIFPEQDVNMDGVIQELAAAEGTKIVTVADIPSLHGVDWRLALVIDKKQAYANISEFRASAVFAAIATALLLVIALGLVIHRMLVLPLQNARKAADAANNAKSEFLASMSHEIRTPMNGVLGMAEVLQNAGLNERQKELASIIVSSGNALMTVINDILDYSKLEAGKLSLESKGFNLRQTVHEVAMMMQARAIEKDLELIVRYAPNLPEGVVGDEARLRQVLGNLVGNAVKFTDRGHVLIDVSGEHRNNAVEIEVSVTDTGIGIAESEIPRMFEKFEQADGSNTRRHGGTGLGLAICKNIVALMNGEIAAESELGKGSKFIVKLSLPVDRRVRPVTATRSGVFEGVRVLAVDDNAVNRRVLEELLRGWGLAATIADNSDAAIDALNAADADGSMFDIIIMDYQMPNEDGVAATRRIQADERFAGIPVVMLSSIDPSQSDASDCSASFAAHLPKPVRPSQLMDLLARILTDCRATLLSKTVEALAADAEPKPEEAVAGRIKVLLAEDNQVNQLVVQNMIDKEEYELIVAENGKEAVDRFVECRPQVILMDISMPVLDGLEATRQIRVIEKRENLARTPIIAATAHVLEPDRERCRVAGMDDFIPKPIRKDALDEIVARWVTEAVEWGDVG